MNLSIRTPGWHVVAGALLLAVAVAASPFALAQDDDLVARGKAIFEEEAGGVGCAYCHGMDASGQGDAGFDAASIVGAEEAEIRSALEGGVPDMSFIELSDDELAAVVAYLQSLAEPSDDGAEPEPEEDGAAEQAPAEADQASSPNVDVADMAFHTVNVSVTEDGFDPATITVPANERVQIVLRNRTQVEHHYKAPELPATELRWLAPPDDFREEGVSDEEHAAHHEAAYVDWRATSLAGIQPTGDEVHLWAYTRAPSGGKDVLRFTPTQPGTYQVVCPLHPEFSGEIHVE